MKKLICLLLLGFSLALTPQQEDYLANFGMAYIAEDVMVKVFKLEPITAGTLYMVARLIKELNDTPIDPNDILVSGAGIGFKIIVKF